MQSLFHFLRNIALAYWLTVSSLTGHDLSLDFWSPGSAVYAPHCLHLHILAVFLARMISYSFGRDITAIVVFLENRWFSTKLLATAPLWISPIAIWSRSGSKWMWLRELNLGQLSLLTLLHLSVTQIIAPMQAKIRGALMLNLATANWCAQYKFGPFSSKTFYLIITLNKLRTLSFTIIITIVSLVILKYFVSY